MWSSRIDDPYLCALMEDWQQEFEWLRVRHWIKDRFGRKDLPDLNAVLFLIGMQELGKWQDKFTKEEKQDLMHIAVCHLLSPSGYYELELVDEDGWPHYRQLKPMPELNPAEQENFIKDHVLLYFEQNK